MIQAANTTISTSPASTIAFEAIAPAEKRVRRACWEPRERAHEGGRGANPFPEGDDDRADRPHDEVPAARVKPEAQSP